MQKIYNHMSVEKAWHCFFIERNLWVEETEYPMDLLEGYGYDCLKLSVLFDRVPETDDDWDEDILEGMYRFLAKFWRLALYSYEQEGQTEINAETDNLVAVTRYRFLKAMNDGLTHMAISILMQTIDRLTKMTQGKIHHDIDTGVLVQDHKGISREQLFTLNGLLLFLAPHMAAQIFREGEIEVGGDRFILPPVSEAESEHLIFKIPVQVDGKKRGLISVSRSASKEEAVEEAEKELGERLPEEIEKVIYVPGRVLSFASKRNFTKNDDLD